MAYRSPASIPIPSNGAAAASSPVVETRTLLTFPTEGLPSPRIVSQANLRAFPVRYPAGSPPAQTQINRWLCCRCAEEGYTDPVGMVHYPSSSSSSSSHAGSNNNNSSSFGNSNSNSNEEDLSGSGSGGSGSGVCWRPTCRHRKCVNCALFAGPLGRDREAKLLIRTVGGLAASPRFLDPVHWECAGCGEWARNRFDSRCLLGVTACANRACVLGWRAGQAQLLLGLAGAQGAGSGMGSGGGGGGGGGGSGGGGAGVLSADSVVMNRYGQRLGTADQRVALADGPWDWQRRALGDPRCAIVAGLRAAMKRSGSNSANGAHRSACDLGTLWRDGEPVPHYPYRRPPPVHENDVEENNEYEGSYLAGMPTEPRDKGKRLEQHYTTPSPVVVDPIALNPAGLGFPSGWNHL
ncbi:a4c284ea-78f6-4b4a-a11d-74382b200eed [Thermothielavioides terrestris]|uniref:Uncharacterized protein n=2 Tax=Thermothielavioides terrestris TaxID=2587410 RepID=G2QTN0_THETT|nr:uncharacterized protein THITE_158368 [Thermothielavioides terrestris NRRL 8126]AEO64449.1 hypothetical protein THITE_158368 [Thermothielavioides terrestris NRRL 8126]SPQ26699.1 a4c284ea-78f6-4b4a-a11d-74382b200eed [Thermothielavioides terrestris]